MLKNRCGLPARTAWRQLWCSNAATAAWLGSNFGAQRPLRAASPHRSALFGSSFSAQRPLRAASPHRLQAALVWAASPHRLEAALVIKGRWRLPARASPHRLEAAFGAQKPLRAASLHRLEAALVLKKAAAVCSAAGCLLAPLEAALVLKTPLRTATLQAASPHRCVLLGSSFGVQRQPSPHRFEAALVLKSRCGLPARTAWKQLWCSKAAADCQHALFGSSFSAQKPLRAASPHRSAPIGSSFGAQTPLQAPSPHRLEAVF